MWRLSLFLLACSSPTELELQVRFAGCEAVFKGPVCQPGAGPLQIWLKEKGELHWGEGLEVSALPVPEGRLFEVKLSKKMERLELSLRSKERQGAWSLRLKDLQPDPELEALEHRRREGALPEVAEALKRSLPKLEGLRRARALGMLGRTLRSLGELESAEVQLRAAQAAYRAEGQLSGELESAVVLSYLLSDQLRRLDEARKVLEGLPRGIFPEGAAFLPYYQALVAVESGDHRRGLSLLALAEERMRRLGLRDLLRSVWQVRALILRELGRGAEAAALLERCRASLKPQAHACTRAPLLTNLGWEYAHGEADRLEAAVALLKAALKLRQDGCPDPAKEANVRVDLALVALRQGDQEEASRLLREARRAQPKPEARAAVWWLDLEGRIALRRGDKALALSLFKREAQLAEAATLQEARWRAALGLARAHEALGAFEAALQAYEAAEGILSERQSLLPLGEGRDTFLGEREQGTQGYVSLLITLGRDAEALGHVRRARARFLASLRRIDQLARLNSEQRGRWEKAMGSYRRARAALDAEAAEDWRLPADQLARVQAARSSRARALRSDLDRGFALLGERTLGPPAPPQPGELILAYFPLGSTWLGFAATQTGVRALELEPFRPGAGAQLLSQALLAPFEAELQAAQHLKILPYGRLRDLDFHALPWEGLPLIAQLPVSYGLDLGPVRCEAKREILLVSDPRGDLPSARREGRRAAKIWESLGILKHLAGEEAQHEAVLPALGRAGIFHYAGHGVFAGRGGWESALPLAGKGSLTVGDILALPKAPAQVLLSGCDTARSGREAATESMGLSHAFLVTGSCSVIAALRPVDDALAAHISQGLLERIKLSPAEALRQTQLKVLSTLPESDWAAFRLSTR